jgi:hypothetical protein
MDPSATPRLADDARRRTCAGCGRALPADASVERCAHCGLPVLAYLGSDGDSGGVIEQDTRCRGCGYNLRGLARAGLCPECAAPVSVSVRQDFLCFAEPRYVAKLARGNRWIDRGLTLAVAALLLRVGALLLGVFALSTRIFDDTLQTLCSRFFAILVLGGVLLFLAGIWLVTSAEPGVSVGWRRDRARKLVRAYVLVGALAIALEIWLNLFVPPPPVMAAFTLVSIGSSIFGVIGLVAYFRYVRDVAARLPDRRLAARAGTLAWSLAVVVAALVLLGAANDAKAWMSALSSSAAARAPATAPAPAGANPRDAPLHVIDVCFGGLARLVALVLFLRAIGLHGHLRKPLEQQAALAEQHWRARAKTA